MAQSGNCSNGNHNNKLFSEGQLKGRDRAGSMTSGVKHSQCGAKLDLTDTSTPIAHSKLVKVR